MTSLEKFVSFAQALPADQLESVEASLSEQYGFAPEELAEIDRRMADPDPQFSSKADIAGIFGRSFPA